MKIDFSAIAMGLNGKPLTRPEPGEDGQMVDTPWTLGQLAATALMAPRQAEAGGPSVKSVIERFGLAQRLYKGGSQDLSVQDAAQIHEAVVIAFAHAPMVAGVVIEMTSGN